MDPQEERPPRSVTRCIVHDVAKVIEHEQHCRDRWFGKDSVTGFMKRQSLTPWTVTAGIDEEYGAWLQIGDGAEIEGGKADMLFNFSGLMICKTSHNDKNYKIEIACGGGLPADAMLMTERAFRTAANINESLSFEIRSLRAHCDGKLWVRMMCQQNSATAEFLLAVHTHKK